MNVLDEAKPLSDDELLPHAKVLIYADPGVGKTHFSSETDEEIFPIKPEEVLYCNVESGTLTLKTLGRKCRVIHINKEDPFSHLERIHKALLEGNHSFKTVVLDSLTDLQKEDLDAIAEQASNQASAKRPFGKWGKQQQDYNISTEKMRYLVRAYRDLPMNVVFICGATRDKDNSGIVQTVPELTPKLRQSVLPAVDIIGYMYTGAVENPDDPNGQPIIKRYMLFQNTGNIIAKDRSSALGVYMEDPSLPKLLRKIHDKIESSRN